MQNDKSESNVNVQGSTMKRYDVGLIKRKAMGSHLDSEGPSLSLRVQTLVSKTQQDLETRRRPTVEPVTLDL